MPIVNYVREHRRFIKYASDEKLTASERLLWYALMEIMNQEAEGNVWPDDFIRISNNRVLAVLEPMGIDTMVRARNALKQRGRIDFRPGNKNKLNPAYRMIYFYPEGYTQNADNIGGNMGVNIHGNPGGNIQGNMQGSMGNIYINQNQGYTKTGYDEDEEEDGDFRARAEADPIPDRREREGEIRAAFIRSFGRAAYPGEINSLVLCSHLMRFSPVMVGKAVDRAAEEGAAKPVQYVKAILDEWRSEQVMQPEQIDGYRLEEDIRRGKAPMAGTGDAYEDWKAREERREERRKENIAAGIGEIPLAGEG